MMKLAARAMNLIERVSWLSPYTNGAWSALLFWLSASRDPNHLGRGSYQGTDMLFRGLDVMAVKEVLVDREYAFVLPRMENTETPVVLDVGAHIGLFSLWLLKQCPRVRVRSIEADPRTYGVLSQNVVLACAGGAQWEALNAAAWGEDGGQLRFSAAGPSMSHHVSAEGDIRVEGITMNSLLDGLVGASGTIDLMKVDIEGSEEAFLCADPDLLKRVHHLVVELHPYLCNTGRVEAVLRGSYKTVEMVQGRFSSKPLLMCY
jgi:FkbM family methyltransferase